MSEHEVGSGCSKGAQARRSAAVLALALLSLWAGNANLAPSVKVHMPGGTLSIAWQGGKNKIEMTGPPFACLKGRLIFLSNPVKGVRCDSND